MRYNSQGCRNMSAPFFGFSCASIFLSTFLVVVSPTAAAAAETPDDSPWQFHILTEPAPDPEDGPPLSASASRDKSLLPAQIGGIVGSYVVFVVFALCALFLVGRRLRRAAQTSNRSLDVEMVRPAKPPALNTDTSPISPLDRWASPASTTDTKIWPSPAKEKGAWNNMSWSNVSRGHRSQPSHDGSVATFDENVVQSDRQKAQNEMERLYAAVMDHDEKKERMSNASKSPISPTECPPEFRHLRSPGAAQQQYLQPNQPHQQQQTVSFPEEPATNIPPSPRMSTRLSRLSNLSFLSSSSRSSTANSNKHRPNRISVRNLPISPPIGSPDMRRAGAYGEDQPLSPRQYTPGPPPPNPSQRMRQGSAASATSPMSRQRPSHGTAGSSTSTLPFRSAFSPPQSAPPTKTTILEREEMARGPRTGIPQTPYSPYMPFTPVTPITPSHFVTRRDRRQKEKDSGMRVLHEDDMVMSDEDMWGA